MGSAADDDCCPVPLLAGEGTGAAGGATGEDAEGLGAGAGELLAGCAACLLLLLLPL